jgi:hypothetical protein
MPQNSQQINAWKAQSSNPLHSWRPVTGALGLLLALSAVVVHAQSRSSDCADKLLPGFDQAPAVAHTGRYINHTYGYSVLIPQGLTAFSAADGAQRGFVIEISSAPRARLSVDASYDAFYDITAAGVHQRDLNTIRLHNALIDDHVTQATLARIPGQRSLLRVQCRDASAPIVREAIIVLRNREIYRLDLQTTPERRARDVRYLDAMLKSWRWEALR